MVDKAALRATTATGSQIWLRDPPVDAFAQLAKAAMGSPVRDLTQVFNVTSFPTVRWAIATLSVLGVLICIVVLLAQLSSMRGARAGKQHTS